MRLTHVLAAVVQRHERFLICQRPAHKRHGGLWEFPGGKIEVGETDLEAAQRELDEELGVQVLSVGPALFSIADPGSEFVISFVPTVIEGEPQCHEHLDLKWMHLEEVASLPLAPSDCQFVEFLRSVQSTN